MVVEHVSAQFFAGILEMLSKRRRRQINFEIFSHVAKEYFGKISEADGRHKSLEETYSFYVVPGGRNGGTNKREVEIFYGNRPFESVIDYVQREDGMPVRRRRLLTEHGASLVYDMADNGMVTCILYPPESDNLRRTESAIILDHIVKTEKLTGIPCLEGHWKYLMSYMQVASLEGEPTWRDRFRVMWLTLSRHIIVDGKHQSPWLREKLGWVVLFVLTVGFSGWALEIVKRVFFPGT